MVGKTVYVSALDENQLTGRSRDITGHGHVAHFSHYLDQFQIVNFSSCSYHVETSQVDPESVAGITQPGGVSVGRAEQRRGRAYTC